MLSRDELLALFERTSAIAETQETATIVNGLLVEAMRCYQAEYGMVFLQNPHSRLQLRVTRGNFEDNGNFSAFVSTAKQMARRAEQLKESILLQSVEEIKSTFRLPQIGTFLQFTSLLVYPLIVNGDVIGVILLMDFAIDTEEECIQIIDRRLTTELSKTLVLESELLHSERLLSLIDTLGRIGSTLAEDEILEMIITNGRRLTNAEGCSLFLIEEETRDVVLKLSSNLDADINEQKLDIRVPFGQGVIGNVVESGVPAIVQDTRQDTRHYKKSDRQTGFATRSLLAVPMKSHTINLEDSLEDEVDSHIIGGLEAVNKVGGDFTENDQQILQILANQAATILEIARAYRAINEIFIDVTRALSAAIDAKDPYTVGHSLRVSNFASTVAQEMGLSPAAVQRIRLGGLLHDVGKIGIPDNILNKPSKLTDEEYHIVMDHPSIGDHIMHQVHRLEKVIPGMIQHHERLDGSGYPYGLKEDEISTAAKIIAVADVFDALTSDRPYRSAYPVTIAFEVLREEGGTHFDTTCVQTLIQVYEQGKIQPQRNVDPDNAPEYEKEKV